MLDYKLIDLDSLQEEIYDPSEVIEKYREKLNSAKLLEKGTFKGKKLEGEFSENLWVFFEYLRKGHTYIDFEKLLQLKFYGLTDEDILLIKSWVAKNIIDRSHNYNSFNEVGISSRSRTKYNHIFYFIKESGNFSAEFINDEKGSKLEAYFKKDISDKTKKENITYLLDYMDFVDGRFTQGNETLAIAYIEKLESLRDSLVEGTRARSLPCSKDILLFDNYIKVFFDSNVISSIKMYYYPILLWWKITNVIPMRASEFCLKLSRDCIIKETDNYYLKIGRLKKKANLKTNLLPVLNKIKITKEIYDLINYYINETDPYGKSETLISYRAIIHYRKLINYEDLYDNANHYSSFKECMDYFTLVVFSRLLRSFYRKIIGQLYNDSQIKIRLLPNDTRHLAFTSLVLQGFSPVEIAIIGGHRTLDSLNSYTCSNNSYINTEVITIIHKNISNNVIDRKSIKNIIFNKQKKCPIAINKFLEIDFDGIKLGYCVADFTNEISPCECENCYNCSKWWCDPTEDSYNTLVDIISNKLNDSTNKLNRDIQFLKTLFKSSQLISIDGELKIEDSASRQMKKSALRIKSNCKNIINIKSNIIDADNLNTIINNLNDVDTYLKDSK